MSLAVVGLLTESIGFAREVLRFFAPTGPSSSSGDQMQHIVREREVHTHVIVRRERVLDEEALRRVVAETTRHLQSLLSLQAREIINEVRRQRVRDAIEEVQARVSALKGLVSSEELDPAIATQLIFSALNPLQVSLEVAKLRLQDFGGQETAWQFCYVVGTTALLAGYGFLGQDMPHLRMELSECIYTIQKELLSVVAQRLLTNGGEIPWEQVPHLLAPDGIDDLAGLYKNTVGTGNPAKAKMAGKRGRSPKAASKPTRRRTVSK